MTCQELGQQLANIDSQMAVKEAQITVDRAVIEAINGTLTAAEAVKQGHEAEYMQLCMERAGVASTMAEQGC